MEACWAHNPEVRGSKPRSAKSLTLPTYHILLEIIIFGICYFNMCIYFCQAERLCKLQLSSFFDKCVWLHWDFTLYWRVKLISWGLNSRVAQWKHAGPITQRSVDRNHALLNLFRFFIIAHIPYLIINIFFCICYFNMCIYFCQAERLYVNYRCLLFLTNVYDYIEILHCFEKWKPNTICHI